MDEWTSQRCRGASEVDIILRFGVVQVGCGSYDMLEWHPGLYENEGDLQRIKLITNVAPRSNTYMNSVEHLFPTREIML
jgi:hypothetical protein